MAIMGTDNNNYPRGRLHALSWCALAAVTAAQPAQARDWDLVPRLTISETYTDNVRLETNQEKESDLITEISPGLAAAKEGARAKFYLDYELQGLLFAENGSRNGINHKLFGDSWFELKPDWFYLEADARYYQRNTTSSGRLSLDSVTGSGSLSDVKTLRVSPYLKHDFSGHARVLARYARSEIRYDSGGASDSSIDEADVNLSSGYMWRILTWSVDYSYSKQDTQQTTSRDSTFESARGDLSYRLTDTFRLQALAGWEDNVFRTQRKLENGAYAAGGFLWRPSRFYGVNMFYGSEYKSATLSLYPTRRTDMEVSYLDRDVGTVVGSVWDATVRHKGPSVNLSATYHVDTSTIQQAELETVEAYLDPNTGEISFERPQSGIIISFPVDVLTLTDEVVERKRASGSASYKTGRSVFNGLIYNERRLFLESLNKERTNGGQLSWAWRYSGTTDFILNGGLVRRSRNQNSQEDDLWYVQWSVEHDFTPNAQGAITLRHTEQESNLPSNEYVENRITARLRMEF